MKRGSADEIEFYVYAEETLRWRNVRIMYFNRIAETVGRDLTERDATFVCVGESLSSDEIRCSQTTKFYANSLF